MSATSRQLDGEDASARPALPGAVLLLVRAQILLAAERAVMNGTARVSLTRSASSAARTTHWAKRSPGARAARYRRTTRST